MWSLRTLLYRLLASVLVVGGAFISPGAAAQATGSIPSMTLDQAVGYALGHNPSLAAARAQAAQGQAARQASADRWLPKLGANAQLFAATDNATSAVVLTTNPSLAIPRLGGTSYSSALTLDNGASWRPHPSSFVGVGFNQQIFDFGLTAAQIASADATLLAERHELTQSLLDTKLVATVSFLAVQVAHQVVTAASSALERATAQRDQAAALVNGQLRSRIFLDRAQAELARLRVAALRADEGLAVAQSSLAAALGFDQPRLDALGTLPTMGPAPGLESALADALANDPSLKSLTARVEAQRQAANAIGDLAHPAIFLTGTVSLQSGGTPSGGETPELAGYLPETPNWDVGLVASWSFFDPVITAQSRAAHAQENVLRSNLEAARQQLVSTVQAIWEGCAEAQRALPELRMAFDAAQQNYDQANVRFKQGLGTSVEIADAETLLTDAQVQLAEGQFGLARARAQLERVTARGQ